MGSFFKCLVPFFVLFGLYFACDQQAGGCHHDGLSQVRAILIEKLGQFDLTKIARGNTSYLAALDAGYDEENRQFFIEQQVEPGEMNHSSFLTIIDYHADAKTLLTVFAPENLTYQWLRCRLRRVGDDIFTRVVFQPDYDSTGILELRVPVERPGELPMLAACE